MGWSDDAEVRKALREPFKDEQIGLLPKPTKADNQKGKCGECGGWHGLPAVHIDYVGHAAVTDRLNKVLGGDWFYTIDEMFSMNGQCWIRGTFTVGGVSRPDYGDGKTPKEAVSNLIRRGAMRFGVAIDLWSKEELESESVGESTETQALGEVSRAIPAADASPTHSETSGEAASSLPVSDQSEGGGSTLGEAAELPASDEQWARANEVGITKAVALRRVRGAFPDVKKAADINSAQLELVIGGLIE